MLLQDERASLQNPESGRIDQSNTADKIDYVN